MIRSANESLSARFGRLRQAPSLALFSQWRRRFTLDGALDDLPEPLVLADDVETPSAALGRLRRHER
jgi:hypothetical protein